MPRLWQIIELATIQMPVSGSSNDSHVDGRSHDRQKVRRGMKTNVSNVRAHSETVGVSFHIHRSFPLVHMRVIIRSNQDARQHRQS